MKIKYIIFPLNRGLTQNWGKKNKLGNELFIFWVAAIASVFVFLATCSDNRKQTFIEPELFARIYSDMVFKSLDTTSVDSIDLLQSTLDSFKISDAAFDASLEYYESHPEIWLGIISKVTEELESRKDIKEKSPIQGNEKKVPVSD